jgi:5'-AMP-activated protein kinase regulatory beta subunit
MTNDQSDQMDIQPPQDMYDQSRMMVPGQPIIQQHAMEQEQNNNNMTSIVDSQSRHDQGGIGAGGMNDMASAEQQQQQTSNMNMISNTGDNVDDIVPTVFKWDNGGRNVYITGTFNNWERQIPMHRSGNEFSYVHNLSRGKHAYKFIVDDEWRFAPDQPTVADVEGRINNFIDVSEFCPYLGDAAFFEKSKDRKVSNAEFGNHIPDLDEYTKEPPSLPPHLRLIILNKLPPSADPVALPEPQHVSLNHLYCTAIKDGMMVLGASQRYRQKYVTIVFYSVMSS